MDRIEQYFCPVCKKYSQIEWGTPSEDEPGAGVACEVKITACRHLAYQLSEIVKMVGNDVLYNITATNLPDVKPEPPSPYEADKLRCDVACPLAPKCRGGQVPECILPPWARELIDGLKEDSDNYRDSWVKICNERDRLRAMIEGREEEIKNLQGGKRQFIKYVRKADLSAHKSRTVLMLMRRLLDEALLDL